MKKWMQGAVAAAVVCVCLGTGTRAKADTTICQATSGYGSYCSDKTPGAANGGYNSLPSWVSLGKTLSSISVADNQVWGLDANGILWNLPNFKASTLTWIKVASGVTQISAGHNLLCQINSNTHVLCSVAPNPQASTADVNGFQGVAWLDEGASTYRQIALSQGNQIWAVDANGNLFQIKDYTRLATATLTAAGVREMAVDGRGSICVTDASMNLYCSNWAVPATTADSNGYYSLTTWVTTNTKLQNITMADGKVFGQDSSANVWLLPDFNNSATWEKIAYGGTGDKLAAATVPSTWTPATFASDEVAVLMFMGQSNSSGLNTLPQRFIAPSSPNVWGVKNGGWTNMTGNTNGASPLFSSAVSTIGAVSFSNWLVQSSAGPDMNLGFNTAASGNAANMTAFQWQSLKNAGMALPDLYIVQVSWASQGVDKADVYSGSSAWVQHGVNLWQPLLTNTSQPAYALAPFSRRIMYLTFKTLLAEGKKPRVIGLQWNQWEAEAGNSNTVSISDAPANYANLFNGFYSATGNHFPVTFIRPLSTAYGATALQQMQTVFSNLSANDPTDYSVLDVSTVSSTIFSGGVLGGGDGSVHYNLDTHLWFANQAIGACLTQNKCGTRVTSVPATATN